MEPSSIYLMNRVEFGAGAVERLAVELADAGVQRPLLVTDRGIVGTGMAERVAGLAGCSVARYEQVPANPTEAAVLQARQQFLDERCDGIIALGGGSPLDFAKAVALLASHDLPLAQYAMVQGGMARIGPVVPIIAIPTTAGTGSEVGRGGLITLENGGKRVFASTHLLPRVSLCDPTLTLSLPAGLTAATGMDAFTHCVEAYLSPRFNPPVDAIVLDGARRAWQWLRRAVQQPDDLAARSEMMMASIQGGLGFQKGLGAVHALSHPLGALQAPSLHHGTCNAVILPAVLRFNRPAASARMQALEQALGLPPGSPLDAEVAGLNAALGLPATLGDMGVTPGMIASLADQAMQDHSCPTNPRPLHRADCVALYQELLP